MAAPQPVAYVPLEEDLFLNLKTSVYKGTGDAPVSVMKFPHIHRPKLDLQSITVQTGLEIAAGGVLIAMLMRWIES